MAHVKYLGVYDARTLRPLDLKNLGVVSQEEYDQAEAAGTLPPDLVWQNNSTLTLPDALAQFLVENPTLAGEFAIVDEADLPKPIISLSELAGQDGVPVQGVEIEPDPIDPLAIDDDPDSDGEGEDSQDELVDIND